jgi:hypothetical protein
MRTSRRGESDCAASSIRYWPALRKWYFASFVSPSRKHASPSSLCFSKDSSRKFLGIDV